MRDPHVAARVGLVQETYCRSLIPEQSKAMEEVDSLCGKFAHNLATAVEKSNKYNLGRLLATLDLINETKHTANDAICLATLNPPPHAPVKQ